MNMAREASNYSNFTGKIEYYDTYCRVTNATFELLEESRTFKNALTINIEFEKGDIYFGEIHNAIIRHCNFTGEKISDSVFYGGVFDGYSFDNSYWYDGIWEDGHWGYSYDKFGYLRNTNPNQWNNLIDKKSGIADKEGNYENFTGRIKWRYSNVKVKNASFELDYAYDIIFHNGTIEGGIVEDAYSNYCIFKDGLWKEGHWHDGIFLDGEWQNGTFAGGIWEDGDWRGGFDKDGKWHSKDDSPDKWDI